MDYNRIYKARYLFIVEGFTNVKVIAEQTGLSLEMVYKAISDDMKHYPMVKADFAEDLAKGDLSRKYPVPDKVVLKGKTLTQTKERYFKLLCSGEITLDQAKSYLIADNVRDSQIAKILTELNKRLQEFKAVNITRTVEKLLAIENLPSKWAFDRKNLSLEEIYPSPMVDKGGNIYGVKYTREKKSWRKDLPVELAIALYELEHPLYIDGQKITPYPENWGPREYIIVMGKRRRKRGYFQELAEFLGMEYGELLPHLNRARAYLGYIKRHEAETGT